MYGSTTDSDKLKRSRERLNILYDKIPDTKGCLENNSKSESEGGCGSWCCFRQTPQVLYSEFLNTWNNIQKNWTDIQIEDLLETTLNRYLFPDINIGCVFIDKETRLCKQHLTRPFNCRTYGIIPEEEFKPRYERLKVLYPDTRNQCNLVSTISGKKVTTQDMDAWWVELNGIELGLGIDKSLINDKPEGSYRAYQDHILLKLIGEDGLEKLSILRKNGSKEEKEKTINNMMQAIRNFREKKREQKNQKEENASAEKSKDNGESVHREERPD